MTKYYDIYTQIPGIKPCPQMWVIAEDGLDVINRLLRKRDFIEIHNIVATDVNDGELQSEHLARLLQAEMAIFALVEARERENL